MGQALYFDNGMVSRIGTNILLANALDPIVVGSLAIGSANATSINIGTNAATTTAITFGNSTTNNILVGNIQLGTDTSNTVDFQGHIISDIYFADPGGGGIYTIGAASTPSDGTMVQILGGDCTTGEGGWVWLRGGNTADTAAVTGGGILIEGGQGRVGAPVQLSGGNATGDGQIGGDIVLSPGSTSGVGGIRGSVTYGPSSVTTATAYQILANTDLVPATKAGIRYNHSTGVWQHKIYGGAAAWVNFGAGAVPDGTEDSQLLQWNGAAWVAGSDITLNGEADRTIAVAEAADDAGHSLTISAGDAASWTDLGGGDCIIRAGNAAGTAKAGDLYLQAGVLDIGGSSGVVYLGPGVDNRIVYGQLGAPTLDLYANSSTPSIRAGIRYHQANKRWEIRADNNDTHDWQAILYYGMAAPSGHSLTAAQALPVGAVVGVAHNTSNALHTGWLVNAGADLGNNTTPFVTGVVFSAAAAAGDIATVIQSGELSVPNSLFDAGGAPTASTDNGKIVWASSSTAGNMTLVPPTTSGHYRTKVGILKAYATGGPHRVIVQIGETVAL